MYNAWQRKANGGQAKIYYAEVLGNLYASVPSRTCSVSVGRHSRSSALDAVPSHFWSYAWDDMSGKVRRIVSPCGRVSKNDETYGYNARSELILATNSVTGAGVLGAGVWNAGVFTGAIIGALYSD